jgi:chemotaxis protein MotB
MKLSTISKNCKLVELRNATVLTLGLCSMVAFSGCVTKTTYNNMLQQQQDIEAALRSEINADQVKITQLENGIRVSMSNDLLFDSGSADLHARGRAALDKVAPQLSNMVAQGNKVDVVGNTDSEPIGSAIAGRFPTNWDLAAARAAIVVRHLQAKGVDPTQMDAISNGQYHPVASNDTAAGRAQNRRTDLLLRPTN